MKAGRSFPTRGSSDKHEILSVTGCCAWHTNLYEVYRMSAMWQFNCDIKVPLLRFEPLRGRLDRALLPGLEIRQQHPLQVISKRMTRSIASRSLRPGLVTRWPWSESIKALNIRRRDGSGYSRDQTSDGKKTGSACCNSRFSCRNFRCKCSDESREIDRDRPPSVPGIWQ
jgi:hypothetical protein